MTYKEEIKHILLAHTDDVIKVLKEEYSDDIFGDIKDRIQAHSSKEDLSDSIEEYVVAAAELIYQDHDEETH